MQTIQLQRVAMAPTWRPAAPRMGGRVLAQQVPTPTPVPLPGPSPFAQPPAPVIIQQVPATKPPFIDSALLASIQAFTGAYITGMLAYGATYPDKQNVKPSRWAYVFLAASAALVFKGFADLARSRER
jgi:hypothetical protein